MSQNFRTCRICIVLALVCLFNWVVPAQQKKQAGKPAVLRQAVAEDESAVAQLALEKRQVLAAIEQLRTEIDGLGDESLRIRFQARIADALWDLDKARARDSFVAALTSIESFAAPPSAQTQRFNLLRETMELISRRDHKWAARLMENLSAASTNPNGNPEGNNTTSAEENASLYIRAAFGLSNSNPEQALAIVESGLTKSDSELLRQMRQLLTDQIKAKQSEKEPEKEKRGKVEVINLSTPDNPTSNSSTSVVELAQDDFPFADGAEAFGEADNPLSSAESAEITRTMQLMMQLLNDGKFEQAIALTARLREPNLRARFNDLAYLRAADEAIGKGEDEAALSLARKLTDPRSRAQVFLRIAHQLQEKNESVRAVEVLRRAAQAIADDPNERGRAQALLALANAAAKPDANYGFELMEFALAALNRTGANKEWEDDSDFDPHEFEQGLAVLARTNFSRAWQLARTIEDREASFLAQLAVCTAQLSK